MKKIFITAFAIFLLSAGSFAQKLSKPTLTSSPPTAAQSKTIQEGVALHDAKKYDEAIVKYQSVLTENADCTGAMYELALTLETKGEKLKAMELANRGTKYISDELPLFYVLIANNLDDLGKSKEAIDIYRDGLKALEGDTRFGRYRSSLYYNLGVTYVKLKNYVEARKALKGAVENDFAYASPHYLLAVVYNGTKYRVPALLAATRLISLDLTSQRTAASVGIVTDILKPAPKDEKTGNINILLNIDAPKDEGDFTIFDLILGTVTTVRGDDDKDKTDNQMFVDGLRSVFAILEEDKKLRSTFVGKTYIPFVVEMKQQGHLDALGNIVIFLNDRKNADAKKWIDSNEAKVNAFINWAKAYKPTMR